MKKKKKIPSQVKFNLPAEEKFHICIVVLTAQKKKTQRYIRLFLREKLTETKNY